MRYYPEGDAGGGFLQPGRKERKMSRDEVRTRKYYLHSVHDAKHFDEENKENLLRQGARLEEKDGLIWVYTSRKTRG